ncbi:MAG: PatB family C-S lyase [Prevotella sp.]|jgi:cystathionine beta-lyase|nr:PatB family C-S lyase [Prevotella sp.]
MPTYNFDQVIDRKGTNALKTDALLQRYGRNDLIPLWVADMDFLSPPEITEAIIKRAKHGVFGYTQPSQSYYNAIIRWVEQQHDWNIRQEWLSFIPGIVKGIAFAIDCFTTTDDKVIIQPPVYHPFRIVPTLHRRDIINNPLLLDGNRYIMDLSDLKRQVTPSCKLLILCNPHNPGGRVWTRDELTELAEICFDRQILVISDEIHSDLVHAGYRHIPFASVSEKAAMNSITFMSPSKTFNIAGIISSYSIIPNEQLRAKFHAYLHASELDEGHIFAYTATQAAYEYGSAWLAEAKRYIRQNILFTDSYLKENIPLITAMLPEASFLVWLDCRALKLSQKSLVSLFVNEAKLALNDGAMFGVGGEGYMRLNVGCPRRTLEQALEQLKQAVK